MTSNAPPRQTFRRRAGWARLVTATAVATATAVLMTGSGSTALANTAPVSATADTPGTYDLDNAAKVRAAQCLMTTVQRKGGQSLKSVARTGLSGSDADLIAAANTDFSHDVKPPLYGAYISDKNGSLAKLDALGDRHYEWEKSLSFFGTDGYGYNVYRTISNDQDPFTTTGLGNWIADQYWQTQSDLFDTDQTPLASKESADAVKAVAAARYTDPSRDYDDLRALDDMTFMHPMYADDARIFLQNGGFPTTAPAPDTMEFRLDVEALKSRFASCSTENPPDPHHVLDAEGIAASTEWQAEITGQKTQRDTILGAEAAASLDLQVATQALGESLGQSIIASRLVNWQAYWVGKTPQSEGLDYPDAAVFTKVKADIVKAQAMALGRQFVAARAAQDARVQAAKADAAQQAAYAIADAAGQPRGRGLLYGQQAAQVTKASAAAATAVAKATETAYSATRASAADSKTQMALAQTQAHASQAEFRRAAAQEAADQAKAAADGAAVQAAKAAENATKAKAAQAKAEAAEATAKTAAADAKTQRATAESERDKAKTQRDIAATERGKAATAEATAQTQRAAAATALSAAQSAGATAADMDTAAENAEAQASLARDKAAAAQINKNATAARAAALEAGAAAAAGTADAVEARSAADDARTAAGQAAGAATAATSAAGQAGSAATAARTAATRSEAAAGRSRAAADKATADTAVTTAAVKTAHAAAADAIDASEQAGQNAKSAKALADTAGAKAVTARENATASRTEANLAAADAVRTAGFAYATAQAALAARDAAAQVIKPANDAIELGSPYKETDASAGLAVLTGQAAKTIAEQQAAVAQAKANQAAKASTDAAALAAAANADAKAAATAAADAAASAAKAAASARKAAASAVEAATAAKAAVTAENHTVTYDQQAHIDAASANSAATDASGYASEADTSATDAERDAASARSAAAAAQDDAGTANDVAQTADQDATNAEQAAANAQDDAQQADTSATQAEEQEREDEAARQAALANAGTGGETDLTPDDEQILRDSCGQECVDQYHQALADSNQDVIDWVKANGGQVLLDVIGVNDARRCFSKVDVEGCLWTALNVGSLVLVVGKLPAVTKAVVAISSGIAKFYDKVKIGKQLLERFRTLIRSRVAVGAHFEMGPYKVTMPPDGNIVNMARTTRVGSFTYKFKTGHSFYRPHTGPGGVITDFARDTTLNPDQIEKAIVGDLLEFVGSGGKVAQPMLPGFTGPTERVIVIDGFKVGYRVSQIGTDLLDFPTYFLKP